MPMVDELIGKFLPRCAHYYPTQVGRRCATYYTPSFVDDDDGGVPGSLHGESPETGYRKGAVSGNKRMTDISGNPDREVAVALCTDRRISRSISSYRNVCDRQAGGSDLKARSQLLNRASVVAR